MIGVHMDLRHAAFLVFLISAAWQDIRHRSISVWIYWIFGGLAGLFLMTGVGMWEFEIAGAVMIGVVLLLVGRWSSWSIGAGDGWFFVIAGIYLGFWANLALLFYGLFLCGFYCLGMVVWGWIYRIDVRKMKIPFLPFLLPAGIWIILFNAN